MFTIFREDFWALMMSAGDTEAVAIVGRTVTRELTLTAFYRCASIFQALSHVVLAVFREGHFHLLIRKLRFRDIS